MGLAEWESSGFDELAQSGEREIAPQDREARTSMFRVKPREVEHLSAMDALGVAVATCTFEDLRDWFLGATEWRGRFPKAMLFAGARSIADARSDERHRMRLRRADVVLGEGSSVAAYAKLAAAPVARFDAVETITRLFDAAAAERKLRVFLCGEDKDRVSRAAKALAERFPAIEIVGAEDARRNASLAEDVNEACADVVLVGMGAGRDAAWIEENFPLLDVGVVAGVGEALDAFAGEQTIAAATRPLGFLATLAFFVRATLYLAFPSRPALPAA